MPNLPLNLSFDGAVVLDGQAMASAELNDGDRLVEVIVCDASAPEEAASGGGDAAASEEITPLLTQTSKPKFNIFNSVSYTRRKPREQVIKLLEKDTSALISLVWSGSRYSGLPCMVASSAIFFMMEAVCDAFSAQHLLDSPLFWF